MAKIIELDPEDYDVDVLDDAAECIAKGGIVAFPTETVYGLAVNAQNSSSVERLYKLKNRPHDKPCSITIHDIGELTKYVPRYPNIAEMLMKKFWPGPLTIIFPGTSRVGTGIRFPDCKVAQDLIRLSGVPVIAPSANISGKKPPVSCTSVRAEFRDTIDFIIDAGKTKYEKESSVIKISGNTFEILRVGAIGEEELNSVTSKTILFVCTGNTCRSPMAEGICKEAIAKEIGVEVKDLEAHGYKIISGGTAGFPGGRASINAVEALREMGIEISGNESKPVSFDMVEEADMIYVMTNYHKRSILDMLPEVSHKISLLDAEDGEIGDPFGMDINIYKKCARRIESCVKRIVGEIVRS